MSGTRLTENKKIPCANATMLLLQTLANCTKLNDAMLAIVKFTQDYDKQLFGNHKEDLEFTISQLFDAEIEAANKNAALSYINSVALINNTPFDPCYQLNVDEPQLWWQAVEQGSLCWLNSCLDKKPDLQINYCYENKNALFVAVQHGAPAIVKILIQKGITIDYASIDHVIKYQKKECFDLLFEALTAAKVARPNQPTLEQVFIDATCQQFDYAVEKILLLHQFNDLGIQAHLTAIEKNINTALLNQTKPWLKFLLVQARIAKNTKLLAYTLDCALKQKLSDIQEFLLNLQDSDGYYYSSYLQCSENNMLSAAKFDSLKWLTRLIGDWHNKNLTPSEKRWLTSILLTAMKNKSSSVLDWLLTLEDASHQPQLNINDRAFGIKPYVFFAFDCELPIKFFQQLTINFLVITSEGSLLHGLAKANDHSLALEYLIALQTAVGYEQFQTLLKLKNSAGFTAFQLAIIHKNYTMIAALLAAPTCYPAKNFNWLQSTNINQDLLDLALQLDLSESEKKVLLPETPLEGLYLSQDSQYEPALGKKIITLLRIKAYPPEIKYCLNSLNVFPLLGLAMDWNYAPDNFAELKTSLFANHHLEQIVKGQSQYNVVAATHQQLLTRNKFYNDLIFLLNSIFISHFNKALQQIIPVLQPIPQQIQVGGFPLTVGNKLISALQALDDCIKNILCADKQQKFALIDSMLVIKRAVNQSQDFFFMVKNIAEILADISKSLLLAEPAPVRPKKATKARKRSRNTSQQKIIEIPESASVESTIETVTLEAAEGEITRENTQQAPSVSEYDTKEDSIIPSVTIEMVLARLPVQRSKNAVIKATSDNAPIALSPMPTDSASSEKAVVASASITAMTLFQSVEYAYPAMQVQLSVEMTKIFDFLANNFHGQFLLYGGSVLNLFNKQSQSADYDAYSNCNPEDLLRYGFVNSPDRPTTFTLYAADFTLDVTVVAAHNLLTRAALIAFAKQCDISICAIFVDCIGRVFAPLPDSLSALDFLQINLIGNPIARLNEDPARALRLLYYATKVYHLMPHISQALNNWFPHLNDNMQYRLIAVLRNHLLKLDDKQLANYISLMHSHGLATKLFAITYQNKQGLVDGLHAVTGIKQAVNAYTYSPRI